MQAELTLPDSQFEGGIAINEVLAVTARLGDLLRRESEFLRQMNISAAAGLQDEKLKLTSWLEAQQKLINVKPELRDLITEEERLAIEELAVEFNDAVADNFQQVSIARMINQKVVQAMTDALRDTQHPTIYNAQGASALKAETMISYNLDQKA
jgi:methionine-rich copper-binding protein CopC